MKPVTFVIIVNVILAFFMLLFAQVIFIALANNYVKVVAVTPLDITTQIITSPNSTPIPTVTEPSMPNYPFFIFLALLIVNAVFAIQLKKKKAN